jgi:shikimate kinase
MNKPRNIVLTGFMATGKTTVGLLVADAMDWKFVDSDEEIVERVGMTIPEIFTEYGEAGFRRYEMIVCQSLAARSQCVIATGGGALINPANLALMRSTGLVICLVAAPEVIGERLAGGNGRPLAGNWQALLEERRAAYNAIPHHIDTTKKTPGQVAEEVIALWKKASV